MIMSRASDRRQFAGDTYEDQMESPDYDPGYEDQHDPEPSDRITCRRCGETGLHWQSIIRSDGVPSHALFNERNRKHVCDENGPDADGFEVEG
jgi:hypothetical protein